MAPPGTIYKVKVMHTKKADRAEDRVGFSKQEQLKIVLETTDNGDLCLKQLLEADHVADVENCFPALLIISINIFFLAQAHCSSHRRYVIDCKTVVTVDGNGVWG